MGYIQLTSLDWRRICAILESVGARELNLFFNQEFPEISRNIAWTGPAASVVHEVVLAANAHGRLDAVISSIAAERPGRSDIRALILHYSKRPGWANAVDLHGLELGDALEHLTTDADPFIETTRLAQWLTRVERQVCVVQCGASRGTGFLVGVDLVLTCYHVVESYLRNQLDASEVKIRLDYRRSTRNGANTIVDGPWIPIDATWPTPHAPYSPADTSGVGEPAPEELDYALLRLPKAVGLQPAPGEEQPRGWVDLSRDPDLPQTGAPIFIVQHPASPAGQNAQRPLQIPFATPGFVGTNMNQTRMVYHPSTLPGSSGSPVFDRSLGAIALHHNAGRVADRAAGRPGDNRGIPLAKIKAALPDTVRELLGPPPS